MSTTFATWVLASGLAVLTATSGAAGTFPLRSPQVVFNNASLQSFLNANDGGINTATDQLDAQIWSLSVSRDMTFTVARINPSHINRFGVYNTSGVSQFEILPYSDAIPAAAGWIAVCHFRVNGLTVSVYDQDVVFQGQHVYSYADLNSFGLWWDRGILQFFSQDQLNPLGGGPRCSPMRSPGSPARGGSALSTRPTARRPVRSTTLCCWSSWSPRRPRTAPRGGS